MIGVVQGDEALGMSGRHEDGGSVVDADDLVQRRMHHQQRAFQAADGIQRRAGPDVVDEALTDPVRSTAERHLGLSFAFDPLQILF